MLFLCPRAPPHQSQVYSKNTLEKVHEGHQTLIISFQESIKIYLLTVFFQPVIFLNFRKNGRVTCSRWVSKVTPAGKPRKAKPPNVGGLGGLQSKQWSMFPIGGPDLKTEACQCPRGLDCGTTQSCQSVGGLGCIHLFHCLL